MREAAATKTIRRVARLFLRPGLRRRAPSSDLASRGHFLPQAGEGVALESATLTSDAFHPILLRMSKEIHIDAHWDDEARVWIATSEDVRGLVVEAASWAQMIDEVRLVLPDLLDIDDAAAQGISLAFKAETHLGLAAG